MFKVWRHIVIVAPTGCIEKTISLKDKTVELGGAIVSKNGNVAICHIALPYGELMTKDAQGRPVTTQTTLYAFDLKVFSVSISLSLSLSLFLSLYVCVCACVTLLQPTCTNCLVQQSCLVPSIFDCIFFSFYSSTYNCFFGIGQEADADYGDIVNGAAVLPNTAGIQPLPSLLTDATTH